MPNFPDTAVFKDAGMRGDCRIFELTESFRYYYSNTWMIIVPAGFQTDGASIPRIFWNILSPFGSYFPAALVHDYLYSKASTCNLTREQADGVFLQAMKDIGVGFVTRRIIYSAVRLGGWASYKRK